MLAEDVMGPGRIRDNQTPTIVWAGGIIGPNRDEEEWLFENRGTEKPLNRAS